MSSARFPITFASVLTTALVAGAAGALSVMWLPATSATPAAKATPDATLAHFTETVDVVAPTLPAADLAVDLRSAHAAQQVGDDVILEARLKNTGRRPILLSRGGGFDLFVQRTASTLPMGLGDVSFLALCEVMRAEPTLLLPGQVIVRTLRLGPSVPFDRPGRYRVGGRWQGGGASVALSQFELVIDDRSDLACGSVKRRPNGA